MPIQDKVSLASLQPEVSSKVVPQLKTTPEGTPRKGKRMPNVPQAVLKTARMSSPAISKVIGSSFSMPIAKSVATELKAVASLRASLDSDKANALKVYLIIDVVIEKDQEKDEASKAKDSIEEKVSTAAE